MRRLLIGLLFTAAAGCSGSDDSSNGISTGLPADKQLADVTADEAEEACVAIGNAVQKRFSPEALAPAMCTFLGVAFTQSPEDCQEIADACLDDPDALGDMAPSFDGFDPNDCTGDTSEFEDCDATVGELETCFNDYIGTFEATLNSVTCDDAGDAEALEALDMEPETPDSCETLEDQCPMVLSDL